MNTSNEQRLSSNDDLFFKDCFTEVDEGKVDAEFNNVSMNCFNSKNNKFSMDSDGNLVVNSITSNEKNTTGLTIDDIYPLGAIFISVNPANPGTLFGGTWELFGSGRTPVCIDPSQSEFDTVEKTGGEKTHKLNINEMPKHTHDFLRGTDGTGYWGVTGKEPNANMPYAGTTLENGGDQPHNNLQPYIVVYMWKRIA